MPGRLLAATLFAVLALAAPAAAARWVDPAVLSAEGSTADAAAVAANGPGESVAAWRRATGEGDRVEVAARPPGGAFGPAQSLGAGAAPDVGLADDGTAVVAWGTAGDPVRVALRRPGAAAFEGSRPLEDGGSGAATAVRVAVAPSGDAVVAWLRRVDGTVRAVAAVRAAGGEFGTPQVLSAAAACDVIAAIGRGGHAIVAWRDGCAVTPGAPAPVRAARRSPGAASFGSPERASGDETGTAVAAAVDPDGRAHVGWVAGGDEARIAGAPPGAGFGGPATVSAADEGAVRDLALATAPGGEVFAAWLGAAPDQPLRPTLTVAPRGGGFEPARRLVQDGAAAAGLRLSVSGDATAHVIWVRDGAMESAHRRLDGSAPVLTAAPRGSGAEAGDLAADGEGNAVAAYPSGGRVRAQGFDGVAPTITEIAYPGVAEATIPLPLFVRATDRWSPVAVAWDFGDGTGGEGTDLAHTYTATGVMTYAATVTDAAGNAARAERQLYVFPARDRVDPVVTRLRMDRRRFRVSRRPTAVTAAVRRGSRVSRRPTAVRRGSRFRYTLSEPAQVGILIERQVPGRLRGKRCVKSSRRARGRRCKAYKAVTLLIRKHPVAGNVSVRFTGRLVARTGGLVLSDFSLKPARYRATVVAQDGGGNRSAPAVIAFTVVR